MPTNVYSSSFSSPIGLLRIDATDRGVTTVAFTEEPVQEASAEAPRSLLMCLQQLEEYFAGKRTAFDSIPLLMQATDFQEQVWKATMEIPFGVTSSYGTIASAIGSPGAARAVGTALNRNAIAIIIPCHRVVPADGAIDSGYAGGSWRKEWLLKHERQV